MGLFRTLLYAVIIYYVWKIAKHLFSPAASNFNSSNSNKTNRNENKPPRKTNSEGEYVDYEEIKD
jgi:hypothetical protein